MKLRLNLTATVLITTLGFASASSASLIGVVDHGDYFTDTTNNLDWLDVTTSVNQSYNYVSSQFGSGGAYEGWRYATAAEFGEMIDSTTGLATGISGPGQDFRDENELFIQLINLLGSTLDSDSVSRHGVDYDTHVGNSASANRDYTWGMFSDLPPSWRCGAPCVWAGVIEDDDSRSIEVTDYARTGSIIPQDYAAYNLGSFLVRDSSASVPVPIPATLALLSLGMIALIPLTRRKV